uniref:Secreted protein n=1 Tax=Physcomitrium patens TaxID=3218 RepID=A0A2K1L1X3_PHYPA|nr:hypothetical protein PHYPA_002805 [Physcomitrium patens]
MIMALCIGERGVLLLCAVGGVARLGGGGGARGGKAIRSPSICYILGEIASERRHGRAGLLEMRKCCCCRRRRRFTNGAHCVRDHVMLFCCCCCCYYCCCCCRHCCRQRMFCVTYFGTYNPFCPY